MTATDAPPVAGSIRRAVRRLRIPGSGLVLLGLATAAVVIGYLLWLYLQPITDCDTVLYATGDCEPVPVTTVLPFLVGSGFAAFSVMFGVAFLIRGTARLITRRHPGRAQETAPANRRPRGRAEAAAIALTILLSGVAIGHSGLVMGPAEGGDFGLIRQAWDDLHAEYVDPSSLDSQAMAYAAINAMTNAVGDTGHTYLLTPDEAAQADQQLAGTPSGLGITFDRSAAQPGPTVTAVFPDSPADHAGVRPLDRITAIDGRATATQTDDALDAAFAGPDGSTVILTLAHSGSSQTTDVPIVRGPYVVPAASWAMVPGTTIALLRIELFSDKAGNDVAHALAAANSRGATAVILDLRGNPGGLASEAVAVTSRFLGSGTVFLGVDPVGIERPAMVDGAVVFPRGPMVLLVDGDTASSAEVVASALRDAGRARLVGVTTVGTGTILTDFPLDDGSILAIGTARWLSPKGQSYWHVGIVPDVVVPLAAGVARVTPAWLDHVGVDQLRSSPDGQFLRAIHLLGQGSPWPYPP